MRNNKNTETIEGRVWEQDLALKTVQNQQSANFGKEFISGTISVATDEEGLNVLTVHYTYVTETTKSGKPNITYTNLKKVMTGKTWVADGKDAAMKVKLTPAAALNDFYPQGGDELVSQPRNEGGFVTVISELNPDESKRRTFEFDTIITGVSLVEANPDSNNEEDYAKINCAIFNFRGDILPFTMVARNSAAPGSVDYFMGLEASASNPVYTQVRGEIVNTTVKRTKTVESAFGEPVVDVKESRAKEWLVKWAPPETYLFDDESTITAEELSKAIANRNVYLEEIKTRAKEYYANQSSTPAPTKMPNAEIPKGGFNF